MNHNNYQMLNNFPLFLTLDVKEVLSKHRGALVNGLARPIEHTAQHVLRYGCSQNVTSELTDGMFGIHA